MFPEILKKKSRELIAERIELIAGNQPTVEFGRCHVFPMMPTLRCLPPN